MSLHHLDPEQEERACPECTSGILCGEQPPRVCKPCHGSGRLGNPAAKPDVRIWWEGSGDTEGFYWTTRNSILHPRAFSNIAQGGPYPTQAAALAAAREEAR